MQFLIIKSPILSQISPQIKDPISTVKLYLQKIYNFLTKIHFYPRNSNYRRGDHLHLRGRFKPNRPGVFHQVRNWPLEKRYPKYENHLVRIRGWISSLTETVFRLLIFRWEHPVWFLFFQRPARWDPYRASVGVQGRWIDSVSWRFEWWDIVESYRYRGYIGAVEILWEGCFPVEWFEAVIVFRECVCGCV